MRWLVLLLLLVVLSPRPALADTSADVVVKATGFIVGSPLLTVTWISDTEIQLDWVPSANSTSTMVRTRVGSIPSSRTDGYLVYSGNLTSFTDNGTDLNLIGDYVYYRAWAQRGDGVWEELGSSGYTGGVGMIQIASGLNFLVLLALGIALTFLALKVRLILFRIAAAMAWLALGMILLVSPSSLGLTTFSDPWVTVLGFLFLVMTIAPLTLQIVTETKVKTKSGQEYFKWGREPEEKDTEPRSRRVYRERREKIRRSISR